jgi:RNA polymerase sigma factor (sigma-70 family)
MPTTQTTGILPHLRRALLLGDGAGQTDGQLLDDYLSRGDQAALAALVRRHAPMVWGVCRRVLRNDADVEDAFQATFLVLVRRAASVVPREMVANWLYGVAHRTALKARATAAKRKGRERQVAQMPEPAVADKDPGQGVRPLLDQELSCLPEKYRAVLVLCDLEGKTRKQAARQLGVPEGTVAGRLARARALLARRFARHGVVLSAGGLATVLAQEASAGVPASVLSSTIKAASLFAAGKAAAGVISARAAALTEGVLKSMVLSKTKLILWAALAVGLTAAGWSVYRAQAADPAQPPVAQAGQRAQGAPAKKEKVELATSPAPVQVLASLDKNKKLVIKTNVQVPGDGVVQVGDVEIGGLPGAPQVRPKHFLPVIIGEVRTRTYDLDKVEVLDTRGRKLEPKEVMKRLKEETLALASLLGEPVDRQHLRLLRDGTLIFVLPAPRGGAGAQPPGMPPEDPAAGTPGPQKP